jgi:LmbE family N-acetylglucosaminyl deacetylase
VIVSPLPIPKLDYWIKRANLTGSERCDIVVDGSSPHGFKSWRAGESGYYTEHLVDMNFSLPECSKVLVIAPHPDDEALGCSGTIMLLNRKGVSTATVFISDGEQLNEEPSPDIAAKRREEGVRASEMLGCEDALFLGFPDGDLKHHCDAVYDRLSEIISKTTPDIIMVPSPIDHHNDHIALSYIALDLLENMNLFRIAFYEVYSTIRFSHLIDISEVADKKKEVIMNYRTSLYGKPEVYVHAALGLNAHRSVFVQKKGYYEAFYMPDNSNSKESILRHLCYKDQ